MALPPACLLPLFDSSRPLGILTRKDLEASFRDVLRHTAAAGAFLLVSGMTKDAVSVKTWRWGRVSRELQLFSFVPYARQ